VVISHGQMLLTHSINVTNPDINSNNYSGFVTLYMHAIVTNMAVALCLRC
jgi:hypothetical protein